MLTTNVQLPGAEDYESQMAMHTSTENIEISLASKLKKRLSDLTRAHGLLDHGKERKHAVKGSGTIVIIMSNKENT